jgi:hypothetical protein
VNSAGTSFSERFAAFFFLEEGEEEEEEEEEEVGEARLIRDTGAISADFVATLSR